ncbi:hypothetical protein HMPREF9446_01894 [Bacteroides fluxus YIT 12057]|uniref:Uncharacterized protein n=2 Tax=Bacteroides fluxus TaxID=626930 RepID=F3PT28_9BACE|nr:hypothetical protein HMPREF9446_01894 [Bacteroides fluxus YIT 12057]
MDLEDDGSRAFADVAISYSKELAGKERGYFTFSYMESDWTVDANGVQHIDNVSVRAIETYDVVHPLIREEAASGHPKATALLSSAHS